jgi:hypothetical protein
MSRLLAISLRRSLVVAVACAGFCSVPVLAAESQTVAKPNGAQVSQPAKAAAKLSSAYGKLPLAFEPNRGQTNPAVQFLSRTPSATLFLTGSDAVLETSTFNKNGKGEARPRVTLTGTASVRMHLAGAALAPRASPEDMLPGTANYLTGRDQSKWQTNVPNYAQVRLADVYPGVDLTYYGNQGRLEYDFIVAPQADPSKIRLQFQGVEARLNTSGDLVLPIAGQDIRFAKPVVYQTIGGKQVPVEAAFHLAANHDVTFKLARYDHTQPLIIDPQLIYLGTLGEGYNYNNTSQIAVDSTGALYVIGTTNSPYYPVTPGAYQTVCGPAVNPAASNGIIYCNPNGGGQSAAYVSKISADGGTLLYSTFISGHLGYEGGTSIAVDSQGIAYLLGQTASNDFPVTSNAYQPFCQPSYTGTVESSKCDGFFDGGGTEYTIQGPLGFMAKLSANGSSLLYSSFLGGSVAVYPNTTALDSAGNWYVSGQASIFQATALYPNSDGGLGGGGYVQFPVTTSGYQTVSPVATQTNPGGTINVAAFLDKFDNTGTTLMYGTFLGDLVDGINVQPTSMAVGSNGVAFIGGFTAATNFPGTSGSLRPGCVTVNPTSTAYCEAYDGFVASIDTTSSGNASLVYATRLGGTIPQGSNTPNQEVYGLYADSSNDLFATGYTFDNDFPTTTNAFQPTCGSGGTCSTAFLSKLNPAGSALVWSTFLGSSSAATYGSSITEDAQGLVYLYGYIGFGGSNFPYVNPLQSDQGGDKIIIVALSADGTTEKFGTSISDPANPQNNVGVLNEGAMAVSPANGNIYFVGTTQDQTFGATPGTYVSEPTTYGGSNHTFFGEISNVLLANSTTAVTLSSGSVSTGGTVKVTVKVTGASGTPTGTVSLYLDGVLVGPLTLSKGSAAISAPLINVVKGSHKIGAVYNGDTIYGNSTAIGALTVTPYATSATVTATPTSVYVGQSITLKANVARTSGGVATGGSVSFYADGTQFATANVNGSGVASLTASTAGLGAGTYSVTAKYSGDGLDAAATSPAINVTLKADLTTSTVLTAAPNPVTPPATEVLTATVTRTGGSGTPTGTVTFSVGTTNLATKTLNASGVASYSAATNGVGAGTYPVVAKYNGDTIDVASTSNTVNVQVQ